MEKESGVTSVLVTGGAGKLGGEVVARLLARGHRVRILTHSGAASPVAGAEVAAGDLVTGDGLGTALDGMQVVIHAASNSQQPQEVDVAGTRHLLEAARASGLSPHIVYVSIVGVDRSDYPYYVAKYAAESLTRESGLPWSILRATQFHSFVASALRSLGIDTLPEVVTPEGVRFQSVEIGEVADRLVALAEGAPTGQVEDMGGPEILTLEAMAAIYLRARGRQASVRVEPMSRFLTFRSGINLTPEHATGALTWEEYVARLGV